MYENGVSSTDSECVPHIADVGLSSVRVDFENGLLQAGVGAAALGDVVRAFELEQHHAEALARAERLVHAEEIVCEQGCFAAAGAGPDLEQAGHVREGMLGHEGGGQGVRCA